MKSAPNKKIHLFFRAFPLFLSLILFMSGCEYASFISSVHNSGSVDSQANGNANINTNTSILQPIEPLFYNRYTGLACDEATASCRPLSVCIGSFDTKTQNVLCAADIVIESPASDESTRFWAISSDWSAFSNIQNISSAKSYMLPFVHVFNSVAVCNGTDGEKDISNMDILDYSTKKWDSAFTLSNGILSSSGERLMSTAVAEHYDLKDKAIPLPYNLAPKHTTHTPQGNRISTIHYAFSEKTTVDFLYSTETGCYLRTSSNATSQDTSLAFHNVLVLFYNVNYYHTASGTSYTLDSTAGGNGFCYTAGIATPIKWSYNDIGDLLFTNADGEKITLNRGKTYIGMMKITDSTTLVVS